jgi:CheY-like chemotaxis protein
MLHHHHQQQQKQQLVQEYKSAARKRILLVNYEDDVNFALKLVLEEGGSREVERRNHFQVDSFNDPILALKSFEKGLYDLLLVAVVMPRMNGFEFGREIRKIDDKVKICFLIAGEVPSKIRFDTLRVQEEGIYQDKFIKLPIQNKDLIEQIYRIINL